MNYILSVSDVNKYVKELISRDLVLTNLWVKGEISNCKPHYSGHIYFTVKDENSLLKCVMFRTHASALKFVPENGMKVIIKGYISVFERDGQYQLYAESMQPDGIGALHIAFEQLKTRLQAEGLFDSKYKKPLPYLPRKIGVVTSSTGAVIRDIINVINRRFRNTEIKVCPVAVQGETASVQIAAAIRRLNRIKSVDVIIVARGGGSLEELWAFNEEIVARGIFESEIPVISAVGHETDYTIADFVADMRAPTPSAAAEMVLPEKIALKEKINSLNARLKNAIVYNTDKSRARYERLINSTVFKQPYDRVYQERMRLDVLEKYMRKAMKANYYKSKSDFSVLIGKLDALSPLGILARGYSIVKSSKNDEILKSIKKVNVDDKLLIDMSDGTIECTVKGKKEKNQE
jgi:exodeoxyribonuclease VII large subunit